MACSLNRSWASLSVTLFASVSTTGAGDSVVPVVNNSSASGGALSVAGVLLAVEAAADAVAAVAVARYLMAMAFN